MFFELPATREKIPGFLFNAGTKQCLSLRPDQSNNIALDACSFIGGLQRVKWIENQQLKVGYLCLSVFTDSFRESDHVLLFTLISGRKVTQNSRM
jgi:hypothetical protein